ncbi:hypothetical protein [Subtercola boreus]|uniref:Transglycosylase n=1 Tax=Subtercola boreus TaxID=120213 RepID=A0A3E0WBL1_9MICO|nr:hypothetical protein [Subtercola boreus]RFA19971.1 hypothetical protein B7R24_10260 [Subtercola boreus]RFA20100.1 hypothetical protein B7R23_10200 [Subtercola boreus]RFA26427.1 hypothetical protein B7R25_10325 [Subtercola boreus]
MELLFVILGGIIIGLLGRYLLPLREMHGALLVPAIGALTAAIVWEALTWLGLPYDGGWIWVITFVGTAVVVAIATTFLGRSRRSHDRAELSRLLAPKARVS